MHTLFPITVPTSAPNPLHMIVIKLLQDAQAVHRHEHATTGRPLIDAESLGTLTYNGRLVSYLFDLERHGIEATDLPRSGDFKALEAWHHAHRRLPQRRPDNVTLERILKQQRQLLTRLDPHDYRHTRYTLERELDTFSKAMYQPAPPRPVYPVFRPVRSQPG